MSEHKATVDWQRSGTGFLEGRYSREHTWHFDGGATVPASPSPSVVPAPWSNPAHVDPEEAFVAAVASCHLLTYLYLASRAGFQVDRYQDEATGVMRPNAAGVPWMATITLHPRITYSGDHQPTPDDEQRLHHQAHEQCFIANSIKTQVTISNPAS
ncbi:MAG: OsmC family protein [Verrucomicrobiales bacterium]|nr:OsmC family protein [Verrucomicrobiales bacterium]MCP5526218.1 OsmC family protein [Verrucomicrobiales bacterium]